MKLVLWCVSVIVMLLSPSFQENGIIYDFKERRVMRNQPPA